MKGITGRQKEIVGFVEQFIQKNRYSPSYREIAAHFGFSSVGSVHKHLHSLRRKGVVSGGRGGRSLSLTSVVPADPFQSSGVEIPLIGTVSAGKPIHTYPQAQRISVPKIFAQAPDTTYALKVAGDSLKEEMILEGDLLLIEVQKEAPVGAVILALINGKEAIVKKYERRGEYVHLISVHADHHPIILHEEDLQIFGILVGLVRSFS